MAVELKGLGEPLFFLLLQPHTALTDFLRMGELSLLSEGRLQLCFPGAQCTLQPTSNTFKGFAGGP